MRSMVAARRELIDRREGILRRHAGLLAEDEELRARREPDLPDVAADATAASLVARLEEKDLIELQRIAVALDRIDAGLYGTCVVCGRPIPPARLRVMPEADRCAGCGNSH